MIVLLPIGAVEAHGPHLPLDTDTRIAVALAEQCARDIGLHARVAPPLIDTAASFAAGFPGTIHVDPARETAAIVERVRMHLGQGAARVILVNLHFDPVHMRAIKDALAELDPAKVVFPNFTRRAHAQAIGGEFATGACHGGEFETSLMLVAAPDHVKPTYAGLPPLEVDLASAIRQGKRSFEEVGMRDAYCGHPATATAAEGERLMRVLAEIVMRELR